MWRIAAYGRYVASFQGPNELGEQVTEEPLSWPLSWQAFLNAVLPYEVSEERKLFYY